MRLDRCARGTYGSPSARAAATNSGTDDGYMNALVIIPTYNEMENLPRIVPAVLNQDDRLSVLIVDDNSPDGTGRLADELAQENPCVHH